MGYLYDPQGQKYPVEILTFPLNVAGIKSSQEEKEQFIFLYHIQITKHVH